MNKMDNRLVQTWLVLIERIYRQPLSATWWCLQIDKTGHLCQQHDGGCRWTRWTSFFSHSMVYADGQDRQPLSTKWCLWKRRNVKRQYDHDYGWPKWKDLTTMITLIIMIIRSNDNRILFAGQSIYGIVTWTSSVHCKVVSSHGKSLMTRFVNSHY